MDLKEIQEELNRFAKYVVSQSRANLTRQDKNVTKELYNKIDSNVKLNPNSLSMDFLMPLQGVFQDRGVKGTKSGKSLDGFKYKNSSNLVGMEYHTGALRNWAKARRIQFKNAKGRFLSYESTGYALANIIKKKGIRPSMFFTKPFEKAFKTLPDELLNAYGLDLEGSINSIIKDNLR